MLRMDDAPLPTVLAHVGGNVRTRRQQLDLSQAQLAERSGVSRRTIINVEAGEANISLSGLDRLAQALDTTFTALVVAPDATLDAIDEVAWRGSRDGSTATLAASVPAMDETQLWSWVLAPGDRYDAEPDPEGWHEMLIVTEGVLRLEHETAATELKPGQHAVYSSAQPYSYVNDHDRPVHFARILAR